MKGFFADKRSSSRQPERRRTNIIEARNEQSSVSPEQRYNFRRNRTLTGSNSSKVASVSESSAQFKSPRVQTHELVKKRRRLGSLLALVSICAVALYGLLQQFTVDVVVRAPGVSGKLDSSYEEVLQSYLATRPIERLRFLVNQPALNDYVKKKFPEIATIHVGGAPRFGASEYTVVMREPLAGWTIQGRQQYVDAAGVAFEKNYYQTPSVQIVDSSGIRPESGQAVASNRFLGFIGRTVGLAKSQGYTVTQVAIPLATTHQLEIRLEGVAYPVKMSVDRTVGEQVEDMARLIKWFEVRKQNPQYIDIRVSGKAFYR